MREKLFDINNPNADIFVIETEEGTDEEDNMCSMIGDAVQNHMQSLSSAERQVYEHYLFMGNAKIFELLPNWEPNDPDPFKLDNEDLENYFEIYKNKLSEKDKSVLQEAIDEEKIRREKSEDMYDNKQDCMISFQDWQENPLAAKHIDLPSTPKDRSRYCGDTTTPFYDYLPLEHPDSQKILNFLFRINRDIDDITPKFIKNIKNWLNEEAGIKSLIVKKALTQALDKINAEEDPTQTIIAALKTIDFSWSKYYCNTSLEYLLKDPVYQLLLTKHNEWEQKVADGGNVYPSVKQLGGLLFKKFRKNMRPFHWKLYNRLKKKFAPRIMVRGKDINRCTLREFTTLFNIDKRKAMDVINLRPYDSLENFRKKSTLTDAQFVISSAEKIMNLIKEKAILCINGRTTRPLTQYCKELIKAQQKNSLQLSAIEWSSVWSYYRLTKEDVMQVIQ